MVTKQKDLEEWIQNSLLVPQPPIQKSVHRNQMNRKNEQSIQSNIHSRRECSSEDSWLWSITRCLPTGEMTGIKLKLAPLVHSLVSVHSTWTCIS